MGCLEDIIWTASVLLMGASLTLIVRLLINKIKIRKALKNTKSLSAEMRLLRKFMQETEDKND
jgi:hypothetical protein